jgi:hypothetical protein
MWLAFLASTEFTRTIAANGFVRNFGPWEKTMLAGLRLVPRSARSVAQISLIPLGVPAMLAIFVLILRRSGFNLQQFQFLVAFSDASPTLSAEYHQVVSDSQLQRKYRSA